jgi:ribose transport system permease protein
VKKIHYPAILLTLFMLIWLSIAAAILLWGWTPTWSFLQVPTLSPVFADMRTVQAAVLSDQQGLDPQIDNPSDPWGRVMNYPKIWLWIAKLFQLNNETNFIVFACACVLAYLICCFFIQRSAPSLYILLAIFSGASLLAVERGNNDILAFALIFAGISLSQDYGRAFSILLATVLKIYPVLLIVTLLKKPKLLFALLLLLAGYFVFSFSELKIIQAGNSALTDPAAIFASYGLDTDMLIVKQFVLDQIVWDHPDIAYATFKWTFIFVTLILIAIISRKLDLNLTNSSRLKTEWFLAGGIIFSGTYILTSNWDYRLIFLLLCMPYLLSLQNRQRKHFLLIGILLSLNGINLWGWLGPLAPLLCVISKYYIFIMISAYLVRETYRYVFQKPIADSERIHSESAFALRSERVEKKWETGKIDPMEEKIPVELGGSWWRRSSGVLIPLAIFSVLFVLFSIFGSNFFTIKSLVNLPEQTSLLAVLSLGSLLVLIVGEVDFSLGVISILGGVAFYIFLSMGVPLGSSIALAVAVGGAFGSLNGFLVAKMRLSSFIVTIGMSMVLGGLLGGLRAFSSGQPTRMPPQYVLMDFAYNKVFEITANAADGKSIVVFPGVSWLVVSMVIVALLAYLVLNHTRYGRYLFLVGSNPVASRFSGIDVVRIKSSAFVGAGMLAGFTGVLATTLLSMPSGGGNGIEITGIICAMIGGASISGGTGNALGTLIGAFILTILAMGLSMTPVNHLYLPTLINGIIIIFIVAMDQQRKKK